jgi:hypothetical protein
MPRELFGSSQRGCAELMTIDSCELAFDYPSFKKVSPVIRWEAVSSRVPFAVYLHAVPVIIRIMPCLITLTTCDAGYFDGWKLGQYFF